MLKLQLLFFILLITSSALSGQSNSLQNYQWSIVPTDENIVGRHEDSFIEFKGKFYLIGGSGINPVNVYDPQTNTWEEKRWIYPSLKNSAIDKSYASKKVIFTFEDGKDEWNDLVVVCNGNKINTFLNNIPLAEYYGTSVLNNEGYVTRNVAASGHIALQLHIKSPIKIGYKELYVRELK